MREGLGPVLPRMRGGVFADEGVAVPAAVRPTVIIGQRQTVVGGLVAEYESERADELRLIDQRLPVEVSDLMAEMPEQRPVRFAKRRAARLTLGVVGLRQVHRDKPGQMPGHDRGS